MGEIIVEEKVNTERIKHLLQNVAVIQKKYDEIAKITGENFNIFSVIKMESKEVRTHSAFIGELLNPKGTHGLKDEPLKIFVDMLNSKFKEADTIDVDAKSKEEKFKIDKESAITTVEKYIGFTNEDKTEGGRIDIIVEDKDKNAIIIENKIYAIEQTNQLIRYNNYSKNSPILYLTLDGTAPSSAEGLTENSHYFNISYKEHIKEWLELCLKEAVEYPMLREVIKQYIYLIKKLTKQTKNNEMNQEIKKLIENDFDIATSFVNAYNDLMNEAKQKLIAIYQAIDTKQIEAIAPLKFGKDSDCITLMIDCNRYSFIYEVIIDNLGFEAYAYDQNTAAPIPVLIENGRNGLSYDGSKDPKEIASEITAEILKIISILNEEPK
jgi:hypothetical protein